MGLKSWLKARVLRNRVKHLPTQREIDRMTEEAQKKGVPSILANLLAALGGALVAAVQDIAAGGDLSTLLSNPKALAAALASALLIRLAHGLKPPAK